VTDCARTHVEDLYWICKEIRKPEGEGLYPLVDEDMGSWNLGIRSFMGLGAVRDEMILSCNGHESCYCYCWGEHKRFDCVNCSKGTDQINFSSYST
jgi:hypothetical protein